MHESLKPAPKRGDWAFAKRALACGEDPEGVIRQITEFRGTDKYDPLDYARCTVMKAQDKLVAERTNRP